MGHILATGAPIRAHKKQEYARVDVYSGADGKPTLQYTNADLQLFAIIVMDNNPNIVFSALKNLGLNPKNATKDEMGKVILPLINNSPAKALDFLNSIPFNKNANNYTTSPEFVKQFAKLHNI